MQLEHVSRTQRPFAASSPIHGTRGEPGRALVQLCREIDAAFAATEASAKISFGQRVRTALQTAIADPELLRPEQRIGSAQGYCRHLLAADPLNRYAIAALVWEPGQASPVHGHRTWCGYAVIEGALAETLYRWDAEAHCAQETRRHPRAAGAVSYVDAGRGAIHQLGNPADAASRAVSLHIYGVAGEQIATHVNDLLAA
ncbi:cysteine dioxygenase family protein [Caballeronia insecticola]|uniref:Predicted metal-dependent enzyme of the double-stranded beta helix superfamily n=1 Tax=Caballeronia insecticola TaxID=758793 RepID=R4WFZ3_9BURK|nr:cysteine dioxygenase family protein [Caballeronia insecticola]BAN22708.1 predicted metal-dependent enzyme of the double-stranded beta helix superfamily [Caballeronia insecticola]